MVKAEGWPSFETWIAFLADGKGQKHLVADFQGFIFVVLPNGPDDAGSFVAQDDRILRDGQLAALNDNVLNVLSVSAEKVIFATSNM